MENKNKINRRLQPYFWLLLAACFLLFTTGCSDNDEPDREEFEDPELMSRIQYGVIRDYSFADLKAIENDFKEDALGLSIDISGLLDKLTLIGSAAKYEGEVQLSAYKVSLETDEADGFAAKNLSGVLLVPPQEAGRQYRQVIAPPYTYVQKKEAPTLRVADNDLDPHLIFWMLEAYLHGYAVIIPDYPGFGDSFGQCYIPYLEKTLMVQTTIAYVKAAQAVLTKEAYEPKAGCFVSGYSLGAYVSLQLARAWESDASYGQTVDFLIVGGAPCDLLQEANLIRASEHMPQPYLFPLALLGYQNNSYPQLVVHDYLREPYASDMAVYLDGLHDDFTDYFPDKTAALFTEAFIQNEGMEELNGILEENSVKPWRNQCKFIMTHGRDDETVYYAQAKDFASMQEQYGGTVTFAATSGTHTGAGIWFYLRLHTELDNYK